MQLLITESQYSFIAASILTVGIGLALVLFIQSRLRRNIPHPPKKISGLLITGHVIALGLVTLSGRSGQFDQTIFNIGMIVMAAAPALMINMLKNIASAQKAEAMEETEVEKGEGEKPDEMQNATFREGLSGGLRVFLIFWLFYFLYVMLFALMAAICRLLDPLFLN